MLNLKQILNSVWVDALMLDIPAEEKYKIRTHPRHESACWFWQDTPKPGINKIFVGEKCVEMATKKPADKLFIQSLLYHELAHSLWTGRNIEALGTWCSDNKVPFNIYNLFEDARIECLFRKEFKRKFIWTDYMSLPFKEDDDANSIEAIGVFYAMKLLEEQRLHELPLGYEHGKKIREYFNRVLLCENTDDLKPILLEWCAEFPPPENDANDGSDLLKPSEAKALESEGSDVIEYGFDSKINKEEIKSKVGSVSIEEFTSGQIHDPLYHGNVHPEFKKYIPMISKIFCDKKGYIASESPAKRLNSRGLSGVSDKIYKHKAVTRPAPRTVNLIIDCSGSMSGDPIKGARTYALLLNELAKIGKIHGHLILSLAYSQRGLTETYKFPVDEDVIYGIPADGSAENIYGTTQKTKRILKGANYNFFYTDGQITDTPIDKRRLQAEGIYTFGMYVGESKNSQLKEWFDRDIIKESFEELVNELIRRIK